MCTAQVAPSGPKSKSARRTTGQTPSNESLRRDFKGGLRISHQFLKGEYPHINNINIRRQHRQTSTATTTAGTDLGGTEGPVRTGGVIMLGAVVGTAAAAAAVTSRPVSVMRRMVHPRAAPHVPAAAPPASAAGIPAAARLPSVHSCGRGGMRRISREPRKSPGNG